MSNAAHTTAMAKVLRSEGFTVSYYRSRFVVTSPEGRVYRAARLDTIFGRLVAFGAD